jgi:hypothetical protein
MAKSKTELERDHRLYGGANCRLQKSIEEGDYIQSLRNAVSAWDYIDGMIQYETRFLNSGEFASFATIDYALLNAPVVFDHICLDRLAVLLKTVRRIDRSTPSDIAKALSESLALLKLSHALWNYIESHPECLIDECRSTFAGDDSDFNRVLRIWRELDLIEQTSNGGIQSLRIRSLGETQVRAKCPACGVVGRYCQ